MRLLCLIMPLLLWLPACDSSDSKGVPLSMYENDAAAALIEHMMQTVPDPNPGVPKSWSIVLGDIGRQGVFHAASVPFLERFQQGGRRVISASVLTHVEPDRVRIECGPRGAVYVLKMRIMTQRAVDLWEL